MLCYLQSLLRSGPKDFTLLLTALLQPICPAELVGSTRDPDAMAEMEKIPPFWHRCMVGEEGAMGSLQPHWDGTSSPTSGPLLQPQRASNNSSKVKVQCLLCLGNRILPHPVHSHLRKGRQPGESQLLSGLGKMGFPNLFCRTLVNCKTLSTATSWEVAPGYRRNILSCSTLPKAHHHHP